MGVEQRVILATPTTLIALLRAVAYGWRQEQVEENARAISDLGRQLYERAAHLRRPLRRHEARPRPSGREPTTRRWARSRARVLPAARRFKELGAATGEEIELLEGLDTTPRQLAIGDFADED